jgi:hypothetical protein
VNSKKLYAFVPIGSKLLGENVIQVRIIEIDENIPIASPSSQYRCPVALPVDDRATSNWNGFPRPRIRFGPGVCIGMM